MNLKKNIIICIIIMMKKKEDETVRRQAEEARQAEEKARQILETTNTDIKDILWVGGESDIRKKRAEKKQYTIGKNLGILQQQNSDEYFIEDDWSNTNFGKKLIDKKIKFKIIAIDSGTESWMKTSIGFNYGTFKNFINNLLYENGYVMYVVHGAIEQNKPHIFKLEDYSSKMITLLKNINIHPIEIIINDPLNVIVKFQKNNKTHFNDILPKINKNILDNHPYFKENVIQKLNFEKYVNEFLEKLNKK